MCVIYILLTNINVILLCTVNHSLRICFFKQMHRTFYTGLPCIITLNKIIINKF